MRSRPVWLPAILAVLVLVIMVATQLGVSGRDWFLAARAGLDLFSRAGWTLVALGALALALRTRKRAAGYYALALLISASYNLAPFLGGAQRWAWITPAGPLMLSLAFLNWAPGALSRWFLAIVCLEAAINWVYLAIVGSFTLTHQTAALFNTVTAFYWALFVAAAWQGARTWRPLLWLVWQGAFSLVRMISMIVQLPDFGNTFGWVYLALAPLPVLMAIGFVWSAFPRQQLEA